MTREEAIKAIKAWNFLDNNEKETIETLIPELKESEDERVKRILHSISSKMSFHLRDIFTEEEYQCFDAWSNDWLEKQGDKDSQVKLPTFTFDDILALQCCMETVKKVQEDKDLYEKLNDLHGMVYDAYYLEKQGEHKPTLRGRYENIAKSEWFERTHDGMSCGMNIQEENAAPPVDVCLAELGKVCDEEQLKADGFDAELYALLKKYEHLSKNELQELLEFYLDVIKNDLDIVRDYKK